MTQMDVQPPTVDGAATIAGTPIIEMQGISIAFGAVQALDRMSTSGSSRARCTP